MNIAKLQSQLQSVPDSALIDYVQNPNGQVPSYLALAEIARRKNIRQQAAPKQPMPTQTVAEQEVASVEPGIAALPVREDMYQEDSFANGGIVAFADGGPAFGGNILNAYDEGMFVSGVSTEDAKKMYPYLTGPQLEAKRAELEKAIVSVPREERLSARLRQPYTPAPQPVAQQQAAPQAAPVYPYADPRMARPSAPPAPATPVAEATPTDKPTRTGIGSIGYTDLQYKPYSVDEAGFDELMPQERAMRDYAAEFKAELGEDPGRAKMRERIAAMEAKALKDEERAPWMALAEAGLGMAAGKSQFALQNIAEGGTKGLKSFADARDNLRKAEERRFDLESKVAQAERAEQLAAINYGADSKRAEDAGRRAVGLAKQSDKARAAEMNAKNQYDAVKDKYSFEQKDREINLMDQRIREQINKTEVQSQRYELQNQREYYKSMLDKLQESIEAEKKSLSPDPERIKDLQRRFDTTYNAMYSLARQVGVSGTSGATKTLDPAGLKAFDLKTKK